MQQAYLQKQNKELISLLSDNSSSLLFKNAVKSVHVIYGNFKYDYIGSRMLNSFFNGQEATPFENTCVRLGAHT